MTKINDVMVQIGGPAGYGIMSASQRFCEAMVLGGLNVVTRAEYPSLIRGGHNTVSIRVNSKDIGCSRKRVDLLIALNKETFTIHKKELIKGSEIIIDNDVAKLTKSDVKGFKLYHIPVVKLLTESKLNKIMANTILVSASLAVLGYDPKMLEKVIVKDFKKRKKSQEIIDANIKAAKLGYNYVN
ncbi:MAG: 2-oxoacid:acceptor oxidoreductase family protein, partial [Nanoarchaeota archaeon]|nr:2-oxoacid:acceptor oxidoreductase family protein [Nanoarchaeota archaeon]